MFQVYVSFSARAGRATALCALVASLGAAGIWPAGASVLSHDALRSAPAISQVFLTAGASVVEGRDRRACRVFREIDVRDSVYLDPTGGQVEFADVARSPAAGVWRIGGAEGDVTRIVLKYPVDRLRLQIGARSVPLTGHLDRAGDSVTLPDRVAAMLDQAFRDGVAARLVGTSRDTGRTVEDRLLPFAAEDVAACEMFEAEGLEAAERDAAPRAIGPDLAAASFVGALLDDAADPLARHDALLAFPAPERAPNHGPIRVIYGERLPGAPDPGRLTGCRMTDLGGRIERYRVVRVEGFVSQSGEAWITRDTRGELRQIYIPGVFEALRVPGTDTWRADVSIAAFANDPFEEPEFKGCLGSQSILMRGAPDGLVERPAPVPHLAGGAPLAQVATGGAPIFDSAPAVVGIGDTIAASLDLPAGGGKTVPPSVVLDDGTDRDGDGAPPVSGPGPQSVPEDGPEPPENDPGPDPEIPPIFVGDPDDPGDPDGPGDDPPGDDGEPLPAPVPVPLGVVLLLSGLASLVVLRRSS